MKSAHIETMKLWSFVDQDWSKYLLMHRREMRERERREKREERKRRKSGGRSSSSLGRNWSALRTALIYNQRRRRQRCRGCSSSSRVQTTPSPVLAFPTSFTYLFFLSFFVLVTQIHCLFVYFWRKPLFWFSPNFTSRNFSLRFLV